MASTFHVANYPGTNGVVRGIDLMDNMKKQAEDFGAIIDDMKEVSELNLEGEEKFVKTDDTDYYAKSVIIATGATPENFLQKEKGSSEGVVCIIVPHVTGLCTRMQMLL